MYGWVKTTFYLHEKIDFNDVCSGRAKNYADFKRMPISNYLFMKI